MTDAERVLQQAHAERVSFLAGLGASDPVLASAIDSGSYGGLFGIKLPPLFSKGKGGGPDFSGEPTLSPGSTNTESVLKLQESLSSLGSYDLGTSGSNKDGVDGNFKKGGMTQKAVEAFQSDWGLPVTGTVNQATWSALSDALGGAAPPGEKKGKITAETGLQALTAGLQLGTELAASTKKKKGKSKKGGEDTPPPRKSSSGESGSVLPLLLGGVVVLGVVGTAAVYFLTKPE